MKGYSLILVGLGLAICQGLPYAKYRKNNGDHVVLDGSEFADTRVFVVGDVHGCYDQMINLLRKAELLNAAETDIVPDANVIFAGDLVNKGPQNIEALRWGKACSRCYVIKGNHEGNILREPEKYPWVSEATAEEIDWVRGLPFTVSIPAHSTVVVHAGLLPGVQLEEQTEFVMTRMRNILNVDGTLVPLEETREGDNWGWVWKGPNHVIYGHDAGRGRDALGNANVQFHSHATGLDTRCVSSLDLTGIFLPPQNNEDVIRVSCADVHEDHPDHVAHMD